MSENDPDTQALVDTHKIATKAADRLFDRIANALEDTTRKLWASHKNKKKRELAELMTQQVKQHSKVKNILYADAPVSLNSIYVKLNFINADSFNFPTNKQKKSSKSYGPSVANEEDMHKLVRNGEKITIFGTAGGGKSFFLRSTLLTLSRESNGLFPIFFELRNVNSEDYTSLYSAITKKLQLSSPTMMEEQLIAALDSGSIALLLDGYDEVSPDLLQKVEKDILSISERHPKSALVVTSRRMEQVQSWQSFTNLSIMPLKLDQTLELLSKLEFDKEIKSKFIALVKERLFERHQSFLSNPLLTAMMLLTFSETSEIEDELSAFYADAYSAMVTRHDARKQAFRRKFRSELSKPQFQRLFSAFCILSYTRNQFQFEEHDVVELVKEACSIEALDADPQAIFQDLCVSTCMLVKDGRVHVFAHRSFQEYFAAVFIKNCKEEQAVQLLRRVGERAESDNVLQLLLELSPDLVERKWVMPRLRIINSTIRKNLLERKPLDFFELFFKFEKVASHFAAAPRGKMGTSAIRIAELYSIDLATFLMSRLRAAAKKAGSTKYSVPMILLPVGRHSFRVIRSEVPSRNNSSARLFSTFDKLEKQISNRQSQRKIRIDDIIRG